jgi:D-tyrosyl-tRNA(Tyr) deacylase
MRAVAQRVLEARVVVDGEIVGAIDAGLLVYLGVGKHDQPADAEWLADKLAGLRIFEDEAGKMSRAVLDTGGAVLVVSQFTLYGDVRRGRRPSFDEAAPPEQAEALYLHACDALRARGLTVATGRFRARMRVEAAVDGPVTLLIDHEKRF